MSLWISQGSDAMSPAIRGRDKRQSQEVHADQEPNVCERYIPAHIEFVWDH